MGVYQSATEPEVRVRSFTQIMPQRLYISEKTWLRDQKRLLKAYKVPARVKPERTEGEWGIEFRWRWFEVETFN